MSSTIQSARGLQKRNRRKIYEYIYESYEIELYESYEVKWSDKKCEVERKPTESSGKVLELLISIT